MPTIELTHATKSFQQFTALNDVSLTVEAGTILCLIGPSGAGKSTLVKCLMGMEKPNSRYQSCLRNCDALSNDFETNWLQVPRGCTL